MKYTLFFLSLITVSIVAMERKSTDHIQLAKELARYAVDMQKTTIDMECEFGPAALVCPPGYDKLCKHINGLDAESQKCIRNNAHCLALNLLLNQHQHHEKYRKTVVKRKKVLKKR